MRSTLDIPDEAYGVAKAIALEQNRSLGQVVGELTLLSTKLSAGITLSECGFPSFRCSRPVGTEDVQALDDD
jgi:hypothetical protein